MPSYSGKMLPVLHKIGLVRLAQILFQLKQGETYLARGDNQMLLFQVTNIDIPNRIAAGEQKDYQNFLNNFNNHYARAY